MASAPSLLGSCRLSTKAAQRLVAPSKVHLLATVAVAMLAMPACGASRPVPAPAPHPPASVVETPAFGRAVHEVRVDSDPSTYSACAAPSVLRLHAADDVSDPDAQACAPNDAWSEVPEREQKATVQCKEAGRPDLLAHALSAVVPLDAATVDHVRAVFRAGKDQGRRAHAFGLVGDSMTVEASFLRPFAIPRSLDPDAAQALSLKDGTSIGDFFRGGAVKDAAPSVDPFLAPRAAKVGVRASWPMKPHGVGPRTPLDEMTDVVSPAYAVILYGANDAVFRFDSLPSLRSGFVASLSALVDDLEARGIVPILTTIPKHMRQRGIADCSGPTPGPCNERYAAQATALSADVASLACERHLPLIDLRWALDPLLNHGVGLDGLHLSLAGSGAELDASGLQCGYNVRNLVTLRALTLVVDAVRAGVW